MKVAGAAPSTPKTAAAANTDSGVKVAVDLSPAATGDSPTKRSGQPVDSFDGGAVSSKMTDKQRKKALMQLERDIRQIGIFLQGLHL
jgi:hypothetical protein